MHYYFKCPFLCDLSDDAIRAIVDYAERMPTEQTQVVLEHMHGVASRVPVEQTAFGLRRVHYSVNIMPAWTDPAIAEKCIDWARGFATAMEGFGASDAYVNYLGDEGPSAVRASYGVQLRETGDSQEEVRSLEFFPFQSEHLSCPRGLGQVRQPDRRKEVVIAGIDAIRAEILTQNYDVNRS